MSEEKNLYLVHYRTDNLEAVKPDKTVFYAESSEDAKTNVENSLEDIVVMSVWKREWSRGDDEC